MALLVPLNMPEHRYIVLYEIGPDLVTLGYTEREIVYALESLVRDRMISETTNNAVRVLKTPA